jgi:glutamate synthase (NADPH/NADH) small chain
MPAFAYEYALAKADGVQFLWHALPVRIAGRDGRAAGVTFARTETASRRGPVRAIAGSEFTVAADMVVKALGQEPLLDLIDTLPGLVHDRGRVAVDPATGATSVPKLFAGGDCLRNGGEVVDAVRDGNAAARGIHASLVRGSQEVPCLT